MTPPRLSIITPSFNQAPYLERTLRSVLDQGYANLEYIVIDGGSSDGSLDIIRAHRHNLAYWVSEPDRGQAHAINKGLQRATGEWVAWQNSDDTFTLGAFARMARTARRYPKTDLIIGDILLVDAEDRPIRDIRYVRPTYASVLAEGMVLTNQAAFWRRNLHNRIGWMDETLHYGFDFDWFLRLLKVTSRTRHIPKILGTLRYHGETKTSRHQKLFDKEYRRIRGGRTLPAWQRTAYRVRRLIIMLAAGQFRYVARGLVNRLNDKLPPSVDG